MYVCMCVCVYACIKMHMKESPYRDQRAKLEPAAVSNRSSSALSKAGTVNPKLLLEGVEYMLNKTIRPEQLGQEGEVKTCCVRLLEKDEPQGKMNRDTITKL